MPPKKVAEPEKKPLIGRVGTNLRVGIVGVPNVGKSTFFNVLTKSAVAAENFPFCTIDPNENKFKCNQHVLAERACLKFVRGFEYKEHEDHYLPPYLSKWYPYVNSYYEFAEDYDAVNRVSHVLHDKYSCSSIGSKVSTNEITEATSLPNPPPQKVDYFTTRQAQIAYLQTKPTCFLILGKPELGEDRLGRLLADYWRCVYIDPETLLLAEILSGSRAGLCIEFNLRCGRAISVDVILRLLDRRLQGEDIKHRGFVLCGFPLIQNDLFVEDPVSSESAIFEVQEIFEEFVDNAIEIVDSVKHVSRTSLEIEEEKMGEDEEVMRESSIHSVASVKDSPPPICFQNRVPITNTNQMEIIFELCNDHDYMIIYLKCSNEELINIRQDNRYDSKTLQPLNIQRERHDSTFFTLYNMYASPTEMYPNNDEEEALKQKVLRVQRDFPGHVHAQLQRYIEESELVIEKNILCKNPQDIIKLDGRMAPPRIFEVLRMRLKVLPLMPVVLPQMFIGPDVEFNEPGEDNLPSPQSLNQLNEVPLDEAFDILKSRKCVGPLYKWDLSEWKYSCPVAMKEGRQEQGLVKFAVQLFNKIFFLSNQQRCDAFLANPRPYLLPPMPAAIRKICVTGPRDCGKTAIAKCIQRVLGAELIDFYAALAKYKRLQVTSILEETRVHSLKEALENMKNARRKSYFMQEDERIKRSKAFVECIKNSLIELRNCLLILESYIDWEVTPLPSPSIRRKSQYIIQAERTLERLNEFKILFEIDTAEDCLAYLHDESLIVARLPEDLHEKDVFTYEVIDKEKSPYIVDFVKKAITEKENELFAYDAAPDVMSKCLNELIPLENKLLANGNLTAWIIDGFPPNTELINLLQPDNYPELMYIITDSSGGESLTKIIEHEIIIRESDENIFERTDYAASRSTQSTVNLKPRDFLKPVDVEEYLNVTVPELKQTCHENGIQFFEIDVASLRRNEIFANIVDDIHFRTTQPAYVVTPEEKAHEPLDYGEAVDAGEDFGEESEIEGQALFYKNFRENRRLGNTSIYDPVIFFKYNTLWQGKEEFMLRHLNKMWLFANKDTMEEFMKCPHRYSGAQPNPHGKLSPRICVVGNREVGKTTQAQLLCKRLGLYYFDFEKMLLEQFGADVLTSYMNNELEDSIFEKLLMPFWTDANKKAIGFVLDGFPKRPNDINFMIRYYLIPDCIVEIHMDNIELSARLMDVFLREWHWQIEKDKTAEQERYDTEHEAWMTTVFERQNQMLDAFRQQRYASKGAEHEDEESGEESLISILSYQEAEDMKRIEEILREECPEPILYDNWETVEKATERLHDGIQETISVEPSYLGELQKLCEHEHINWHTVDGNLETTKVYNVIMQHIMQYLFRNSSFFERAYDVWNEMATKLLESGYYFLSRFGKTCPVQMYENYNPLQMYLNREATFQIFPMIYNNYIYFISGAENRVKFKKDILKYTNQEYMNLPLFRVRLAIIGPPHCGKTTISERVAAEYMLEHISVGKAVRRILTYMPSSILAQRVHKLITKGEEVTEELAMQCVEAMTFEARAIALGFVMDGIPNKIEDIKLLAQMNLVPHLVIDLEATLNYIYEIMDIFEVSYKPPYSRNFLKHRYNEWTMDKENFRAWADKEYQNFATVSVMPSRWKTWHCVNELILAVVIDIKYYYKYCDRDVAIRVANMLVTPYEFIMRQSSFKNYCPLCLYYNSALNFGANPPDRTNLIYYHGLFYWLCDLHCNEFLSNPDAYMGINVKHTLPPELPELLNLTEMPNEVSNNGYCNVCLEKHKPELVLNLGQLAFCIKYDGVIYLFDTVKCCNEFFRRPYRYAGIKMRMDVSSRSMDLHSLPTLGLLEQYVATQVIKALLELETLRPVIPGLTVKQSAVVCLGLFLKINNPNTPDVYVSYFKKSKKSVIDSQTELRRTVKELKQTINPYLHYEEPLPAFDAATYYQPEDLPVSDDVQTIMEEILFKVELQQDQIYFEYDLYCGG